nr:hypothetical protein [Roseomonas sp. SXEYE001]
MTAFAPGSTRPARMPPVGRRTAGLSLLSLALAAARPAMAQPVQQSTVLVPGPEEGSSSAWTTRAVAALARGHYRPVALQLSHLGGPDGVTAANRFATLEPGDGDRFLTLPGMACQAWLTGATRARFEPRAWLPLLVSWNSAVLAGRGRLPSPGAAPLRVAIPSPDAPEAAALALLDLLGVPAQAVTGPAEAAFRAGEADALIIAGPAPIDRAKVLGATPWYQLSPTQDDATDLPPLPVRSPAARGALAAVAALQLRAALVMPYLTPADTVATWRRAALRWQEEERTQPGEGRPMVGAQAAAAFALLAPPPDAVLSYRSWLERRLGWRAG